MTSQIVKILATAIASLLVATPAFAADTFTEAVALTDGTARTVDQTDFVRLSSNLDMSRAAEIDAAFTEYYGTPVTQRNGVKVWEVKNKGAGNDLAKTLTIMCGVEDGKIQITIDARKPDIAPVKLKAVKLAPRAAVRAEPQARSMSTLSLSNKNEGRNKLELRPENSDR